MATTRATSCWSILLSSISSIKNSFYGKPPEYIYTPENSEKKIKIGYNDDIFLKLTITIISI